MDGIGVWEIKLADGNDAEALEQLEASGLGSAAAIPAVPSILPLPLMKGPAEPEARIEAICAGIRRLAPFEPSCVLFLTGPGDDRATILEGLRAIAVILVAVWHMLTDDVAFPYPGHVDQ